MTGAEMINAERKRQIEEEGFDKEHDKQHTDFELAEAAICYAYEASREGLNVCIEEPYIESVYGDAWPEDWYYVHWKPEPRDGGTIKTEHSIRMLIKAGALIAAQIDRLMDRDRSINDEKIL